MLDDKRQRIAAEMKGRQEIPSAPKPGPWERTLRVTTQSHARYPIVRWSCADEAPQA